MGFPQLARVLYDYPGNNVDELPILCGEMLLVEETSEPGWYKAKTIDRISPMAQGGLVPGNYLQVGLDFDTVVKEKEGKEDKEKAREKERESDKEKDKEKDALGIYGSQRGPKSSRSTFSSRSKPRPSILPDDLGGHRSMSVSISLASSSSGSIGQASPSELLQQKFWYQDWEDQSRVQELLATMTDEEKSYQQALYEILSTEQDYVRNVETVIEVFIVPMSLGKLLDEKGREQLFGNLQKLVPMANHDLLTALKKARAENGPLLQGVGEIFIAEAGKFRAPYSEYFKNYTTALEFLQQRKKKDSQFNNFLKESTSNPKLKKITLDGFLLTPVQRVMKYPVLLEAALKYCPASHPEHNTLKEAHQVISRVLLTLNEDKRMAENVEKIQEVAQGLNFNSNSLEQDFEADGSRTLEKEGVVGWSTGEGNRDVRLYLFNDILLVTKNKDKNKKRLLLDVLIVESIIVNDVEEDAGSFEVVRDSSRYAKRYLFNGGDEGGNWKEKLEKMGVMRNVKTEKAAGSTTPMESVNSFAEKLRMSRTSIVVNEHSLPQELQSIWEEIKIDLKKIQDHQAGNASLLQQLAAEQKTLAEERRNFNEQKQAFLRQVESSGNADRWTGETQSPIAEPERPIPLSKPMRLNNTTLILLNHQTSGTPPPETTNFPKPTPAPALTPTIPVVFTPPPPALAPKPQTPVLEPIETQSKLAPEPEGVTSPAQQPLPTPLSQRPTKALPIPTFALSPRADESPAVPSPTNFPSPANPPETGIPSPKTAPPKPLPKPKASLSPATAAQYLAALQEGGVTESSPSPSEKPPLSEKPTPAPPPKPAKPPIPIKN